MTPKRTGRLSLPGAVPVDMREVKHRNKPSVLRDSQAYKNAVTIIEDVKKNGPLARYEGYTIVTAEDIKKTDPELAKMRTWFPSLRATITKLIEENGVQKELVVVARGNSKIYMGNIGE